MDNLNPNISVLLETAGLITYLTSETGLLKTREWETKIFDQPWFFVVVAVVGRSVNTGDGLDSL
jgi:hypothetical protein